jgi:hypothetical protein
VPLLAFVWSEAADDSSHAVIKSVSPDRIKSNSSSIWDQSKYAIKSIPIGPSYASRSISGGKVDSSYGSSANRYLFLKLQGSFPVYMLKFLVLVNVKLRKADVQSHVYSLGRQPGAVNCK